MGKNSTFKSLKDRMSSTEFDAFCKDITISYAKSEAQFSRSYYTKTYNITEKCFYSVIEYALTRNLVDDEIFLKAREKAAKNSAAHAIGACQATYAKYSKMYIERLAYSVPEDKAREISQEYANNPEIALAKIANLYNIHPRVMQKLLERVIVENICEDDTFKKIEQRNMNCDDANKMKETKRYFSNLKRKRKANKK